MFELTETLYLTEDRKKAVKEGDKAAAFLLGVKGSKITDTAAEKLGLKKSESGAFSHRDPVVTNRDLIESRHESAKAALPIVPGPAPAPAPKHK